MKDVLGIINLSEPEEQIKELTAIRPLAAIPIAGRYRVIDFLMSNLVNSGVRDVAVFTQGKSRSLMDHFGSGKYWDLDRKRGGLFLLNPMMSSSDVVQRRGDIENFKNHLDFIYSSRAKYVIISRSYMICNVDLKPAFKHHKDSGADITILYKHMDNSVRRFINCDSLNLDEEGNVLGIGKNLGKKKFYNISTEMYIMKKELMTDIIEEGVHMGDGDYLKQVLFNRIQELHVNAYPIDGYMACINSIENYYLTNMDLLNMDVSRELFFGHGLIYTKIKDEPATKYGNTASVSNSLIANGCHIEGVVENSIIGRGVTVGKGAIVRNSILMQNCYVDETASLNYAILDKNVSISKKKMLFGHEGHPYVIKKGVTI